MGTKLLMCALRNAALAGLAVVAGCVVTEPANGTQLTPSSPVDFRGYASLPDQRIEIQARDGDGEFETFARTRSSRDALELDDGSRVYGWEVRAVVPYWQGSGCDQHAVVRARARIGSRASTLFTFDEAGSTCVRDALNEGTPLARAITECGDSLDRTIELRVGADVRIGDVEVTNQSEADALACVRRIEGSLTVKPDAAELSLPVLEEVTGDVFIEVEDTDIPVEPESSRLLAEHVTLPALRAVGGDLTFHHLDGAYGSDVRIDIPSLTSLPGDLNLVLSSFNGYNKGLVGLTTVDGNVHIQARGDYYPLGLLEAVTHIAGDLVIRTNAGSSGGIFPGLKSVGGSVELSSLGRQTPGVFVELRTVGGDFIIQRSYWGEPHYPALERVVGVFRVEDADYGSALPTAGIAGSPTLALGAFELRRTSFAVVPLSAGTRVGVTGGISIEDNEFMCQDSVDVFVATQQGAGWSGALSVSGNGGSCPP